jgi:hypothetical protein
VEEFPSVLAIRWIEKAVHRITSLDPRDMSRDEPIIIKRKMETAIRRNAMSYCRDFNKEGLTKPFAITTVMMEELYRRTGWSAFHNTQFFSSWTFELDGIVYEAKRGHGLGMGNSLTTLMSIVIEEMIYEETTTYPNFSAYNNDDAALAFSLERICLAHASLDREICEKLGLDFKPKASFVSKNDIVFLRTIRT